MIDIKNLTTFQITALTLAVAFSILALAEIFYTLKNSNKLSKKPILKFCVVVLIPYIAISCWALTLLSVFEFFAKEEAISIVLALVIGAAVILAVYFIAKTIEISRKDVEKKEDIEVIQQTMIEEEPSEQKLLDELTAVEKSLQELKEVIDDVIEDAPEFTETHVETASVEEVIEEQNEFLDKVEEKLDEIEEIKTETEINETETKIEE